MMHEDTDGEGKQVLPHNIHLDFLLFIRYVIGSLSEPKLSQKPRASRCTASEFMHSFVFFFPF